MKDSLRTLQQLETMPSCNKIAASFLIHSCSTLEGTVTPPDNDISRGADFIISEEINIYAARLAVCELSSARASVPAACNAFMPTNRPAKRTTWAGYLTGNSASKPRQLYPDYNPITEQDLGKCLSALHGREQSWTSFSTSKQSAGVMCHAMRGEVEKDHQIHLYKILASTTEDIVEALFRSKQDWQDFTAGFNELSSNIRQYHMDLVQEDEQRLEAARRMWAEWQADVQGGLQNIATGVQDIRSDVDKARDSVKDHTQHVHDALEHASGGITDLAVQHSTQMRDVNEETVALKDMVEYTAQMIKQDIQQGAYIAGQSLALINILVANVTDDLGEVSSKLDKIKLAAESVEMLNASVESLSDVLNGNWLGALRWAKTCAAFAGYAVVYSLLSVGVWQRVMQFSGSICASIASGLVLAYISTCYFGPPDALRYASQHLSAKGILRALSMPTTMLVGALLLVSAVFCSVHRLLTGRWLPTSGHQTATDLQTHLPSQNRKAFRLPVNDPKHMAEVAERSAMRGGGLRRGEV